MDNNKPDRRVRKTKAILRKTLTKLLMEKDLKDISVLELTDAADINRGTFYLHYKDIYDLFEQIEQETLEDFLNIIVRYKQLDSPVWTAVMLDLFKYISANADIFIAVLNTKESNFLTDVIEISRPKTKQEWHKLFSTGKEEYYEYYYDFFTFGCIALVRSWFMKGMPESCEQMAELIEKLMLSCISGLK
ncbi:MAG: TetR/AcrR family transcriptional regulator [Oscillospiraceae bacterium]|jgi:AcrR family transcriptional regulator|nr:TetR/AcrR family transcriptional regulator [Oscillospiraceae bacterium]